MFARLVFDLLARWLDGYKTYLGGIALILSGISGIIGHYWPDQALPNMDPSKGLDVIALGLSIIGIGRKMEKMIEQSNGNTKRGR